MAGSESLFRRAPRRHRGYAVPQVDAFLARVEAQLADPPPAGSGRVSAAEIRRAGFELVPGGYAVAEVDAQLDRLEQRVVEAAEGAGDEEPDLARRRDAVRRLLGGPPGRCFPRAARLRRGYSRGEVDAFVATLLADLGDTSGRPSLDPSDVRAAVFHPRRGGYDEGAVDDALDEVVDLLLRAAALGRRRSVHSPHPAEPATEHDGQRKALTPVSASPTTS